MSSFLEKMFMIEGIIFAIIGLLFFIFPVETIISFSILIAILFIVVGVLTILRCKERSGKLFFIFNGMINILFGLVLWLYPISTINLLTTVYGTWLLIRGAYLLFMSFKNGHFGFNIYTLSNAFLIIFAAIIIFQPFSALITVPYCIGGALIVMAIGEIYLGIKLRNTF